MRSGSGFNNSITKMIQSLGLEKSKELADKIENVDVHIFSVYDFIPDLVLTIRSYVIKKRFKHRFVSVPVFENGIFFSFHNFFRDPLHHRSAGVHEELPHVKIIPMNSSYEQVFYKNTHMKHVGILVSTDYLKQFLKDDAEKFNDLLACTDSFIMEEPISDDVLRTINEIVNAEKDINLTQFYFRLKSIELLYYLFQRLGKREQTSFQRLTKVEIDNLYKVRARLIAQLDEAPTLSELTKIGCMNEIKLRKSFIQIFGKGMFEYYQHLRIQEAARLIREEKLTVTEAGHRLGFTNLSHFSRVFEEHVGMKPKRYSMT